MTKRTKQQRAIKEASHRLCLHCQHPFTAYPSRVADGKGKYCSQQCADAHHKQLRPSLVCIHCGEIFQTKPLYVKRGRKFCSLQCLRKAQHLRKEERHLARQALDRALEGLVTLYGIFTNRGRLIYVGRVRAGREQQRLHEHRSRGPCAQYKRITLHILETVPAEHWRTREKYWITHYQSLGYRLLNRCAGGGGSSWPIDQRVEKHCLNCGRVFFVKKSEHDAGRGRFCSKHCQYSMPLPTRPCTYCQTPITLTYQTRKRQYCSSRCAGLATRTRIPRGCPECGKQMQVKPSYAARVKVITCSRKCMKKQRAKGKIQYHYQHGDNHSHAKLTEKQVRRIFTLRGKMPQRKIAQMFQVSPSVICNILKGKTWKHFS